MAFVLRDDPLCRGDVATDIPGNMLLFPREIYLQFDVLTKDTVVNRGKQGTSS